MPQFYVPEKNVKGTKILFDPTESRHLTSVLRKRPGETVLVFNGEGGVKAARLTDCSNPDRVQADLLDEIPPELLRITTRPDPAVQAELTLCPALIKGERFEWLLEKAAELGVAVIRPLLCERSVVEFKPERATAKLDRWNKILLSAAKQCGRSHLPQMEAPVPFSDALMAVTQGSAAWILSEREDSRLLSAEVRQLRSASTPQRAIFLFIGPEGGWTASETGAALSAGVLPVTLGPNILRAETAAIAACSLALL